MKKMLSAAIGLTGLFIAPLAFGQNIPSMADLLGGYTGPNSPPEEWSADQKEVYQNMRDLYERRLNDWISSHPGEYQLYQERIQREKTQRAKSYADYETVSFLSEPKNQKEKHNGKTFEQTLYSYVVEQTNAKSLNFEKILVLPHVAKSAKFPSLMDLLLNLSFYQSAGTILALSPEARQWPQLASWFHEILESNLESPNQGAKYIGRILRGEKSEYCNITAAEATRLRNHPDSSTWINLMMSSDSFVQHHLRDFLDWTNVGLLKRFLPSIIDQALRNSDMFETMAYSLFETIPQNPYLLTPDQQAGIKWAAQKVFGALEVPRGLKQDEKAIARTIYLRVLVWESQVLSTFLPANFEKTTLDLIQANRKAVGSDWFEKLFFESLSDRRGQLLIHFAQTKGDASQLLAQIHKGVTTSRTSDGYFVRFSEWIPDVSIQLYRKAGSTVADKKVLGEILNKVKEQLTRGRQAGTRIDALLLILEQKFGRANFTIGGHEPTLDLVIKFYEDRLFQGIANDSLCNNVNHVQTRR